MHHEALQFQRPLRFPPFLVWKRHGGDCFADEDVVIPISLSFPLRTTQHPSSVRAAFHALSALFFATFHRCRVYPGDPCSATNPIVLMDSSWWLRSRLLVPRVSHYRLHPRTPHFLALLSSSAATNVWWLAFHLCQERHRDGNVFPNMHELLERCGVCLGNDLTRATHTLLERLSIWSSLLRNPDQEV